MNAEVNAERTKKIHTGKRIAFMNSTVVLFSELNNDVVELHTRIIFFPNIFKPSSCREF